MSSRKSLQAYVLSVGTCLIFFKPQLGLGFGNHEIIPYYALALLMATVSRFAMLAIVVSLLIAMGWYISSSSGRAVIDAIEVGLVVSTIIIFSKFTEHQKIIVCRVFSAFLIINFILIVLQYLFVDVQRWTYVLFSSRDPELGLQALARNGARTGLAPEPAYGAALVVGLLSIIHMIRPNIRIFILSSLSVLLLQAITGFFYLAGLVAYLFLFKIDRRWRSVRGLWTQLRAVVAVIGAATIALQYSFTDRLVTLFQNALGSDLLTAEAEFGSIRLSQIVASMKIDGWDQYHVAFSLPTLIVELSGLGAVVAVGLLITLMMRRGILEGLFLGLYAGAAGPVMVWPIYYLTFRLDTPKTNHKCQSRTSDLKDSDGLNSVQC